MRSLSLLILLAVAATPVRAEDSAFGRADPQTTSSATPTLAPWWEMLADPVLSGLIDAALADNPGMAAAAARVEGARAAARIQRTSLLPQAGLAAGAAQLAIPGGSGDSDARLSFAGLDARWELDLFGRNRQGVRASRADFEAAQAAQADHPLRLAAEVGTAYVGLRAAQLLETHAREMVVLAGQRRDLVRLRIERGASTTNELDQADAIHAEREAGLARIVADVAAYKDALSVLTGQQPGTLDALLASPAPIPVPPATVAIGDPSAMLQRRPDIRAAERQRAASNARTRAAKAARFPQITLFGLIGIGDSDQDIGGLDGDVGLGLIPMLRWDFLDFGRAAARVKAAKAAETESDANYRTAVNAALQDAEDALSRYGQSRIELAARSRQRNAAANGLERVSQRLTQGSASEMDRATARATLLESESRLAMANAQRTMRFIALQKALGLGWRDASRPSEAVAR